MLKSNTGNMLWHLCHIDRWCLLAIFFSLTSLHFFPQPYTFGTPTVPTDSPHSNKQLIELMTAGPSVDWLYVVVCCQSPLLYEYKTGFHLEKSASFTVLSIDNHNWQTCKPHQACSIINHRLVFFFWLINLINNTYICY